MDGQITPLSRERMEEMLADYAFGALSEAEVLQFEQSLPQYPDVQNEVHQIREAFAQFDKQDFLERQTRPARTLSVHVQERLSRRQSRFGGRSLRHVAPALGVALLIAFVFAPGGLFRSPDAPVQVVATHTTPEAAPETSPAIVQENVSAPVASSLAASTATPKEEVKTVRNQKVKPVDRSNAPDPAGGTTVSDIDNNDELEFAIDDTSVFGDELADNMADDVLFPMSYYSFGGEAYDEMQEAELQQLLEELDNEIL